MDRYDEDIFEAVAEIVAATMEEAEVDVSAEGGKQVAEYFLAIYKALEKGEVSKPANGKFEIYEDGAGEFRFRLKAGNGEVIAVSEGYKTKSACLKGIESVRRNAQAPTVEK